METPSHRLRLLVVVVNGRKGANYIKLVATKLRTSDRGYLSPVHAPATLVGTEQKETSGDQQAWVREILCQVAELSVVWSSDMNIGPRTFLQCLAELILGSRHPKVHGLAYRQRCTGILHFHLEAAISGSNPRRGERVLLL